MPHPRTVRHALTIFAALVPSVTPGHAPAFAREVPATICRIARTFPADDKVWESLAACLSAQSFFFFFFLNIYFFFFFFFTPPPP
jgi:hypothetical protein